MTRHYRHDQTTTFAAVRAGRAPGRARALVAAVLFGAYALHLAACAAKQEEAAAPEPETSQPQAAPPEEFTQIENEDASEAERVEEPTAPAELPKENKDVIAKLKRPRCKRDATEPYTGSASALEKYNAGLASSLSDPEGAARSFQDALAEDPKFHQAAFNAALAYEQANKLAEAEQAYRHAMEIKESFQPAVVNLAMLMIRTGREGEAEQLLEREAQKDKFNCMIKGRLASIYLQSGRKKEAARITVDTLELDDKNIDAQLNMAMIFFGEGKFELAQKALLTAKDIDPNQGAIYNLLGNVLLSRGDIYAARENYERAVQLRPDLWEARINLAALLNEMRNPEKAEENLRVAEKLRPDHAPIYVNLGNSLRAQRKFAEAQAAYEKALELDPKWVEVYFNLAILKLDDNTQQFENRITQLAEARKYFEQFSATMDKAESITTAKDKKRWNEKVKRYIEQIDNYGKREQRAIAARERKAKQEAETRGRQEKCIAANGGEEFCEQGEKLFDGRWITVEYKIVSNEEFERLERCSTSGQDCRAGDALLDGRKVLPNGEAVDAEAYDEWMSSGTGTGDGST